MRLSISKCKFFVEQLEYQGNRITRQYTQATYNRIEVTLNMKVPKLETNKQIRQFIGILNYYQV
jgi:hypothetical protein